MERSRNHVAYDPILLLNSTYEPITVVDWQKAMTLLVLGKVEVLTHQKKKIHTATQAIGLPSVMRLLQRVYVPYKRVKFTRTNVYLRDKHTCQYCRRVFPRSKLTLDHIIPRSRRGPTSWTNVATCCSKCNRLKGDRTPHEANMPLLREAYEPKWSPAWAYQNQGSKLPKDWEQYLWF